MVFDRFWLVGLAALMAVTAQAAAPAQAPRWVQADDVLVRAGPGLEHKAVGALQRGAELILKDASEHGGYCLIEGEGQYGYVACRYLSSIEVARAQAGEGGVDPATRWVSGSAVNMREAPLADAPVMTRLALNTKVRLLHDEVAGGYCEIQPASGPRGFTACRYLSASPLVLARVIGLVRVLEFPAVQPSLFRGEADIAPPGAGTEALSGRFGIVYRQLVSPRPHPGEGAAELGGAGLYDMLARTTLLVRPVERVQLLRDGRLRSEPSLARQTETLWRDVEEAMCSGWHPGFSFGDADATIWRYFDGSASVGETGKASRQESLKRNPAGSLYAFYAAAALPRSQAA